MLSREPLYHQPLGNSFDEVLRAIGDENRPSERTLGVRPFVKWVGGKRSILKELIARLPKEYKTYYEPFVGGGALFFAVQPRDAYLSDVNFHLMITYKAVRDDVKRLITNLKVHERNHSKEYYLKARIRLFKEKDPTKIAGLFIYLNKTCYNGLYRVNKSGQFNVPMGDYKNPAIVDEETLFNASKLLETVDLQQHGFGQLSIKKGAFYYIDPPYHETYSSYSGDGFGDKEHTKLAEFCRKIDNKDGFFMVSNSDTKLVRTLYKGYNIEKVSASRSVSCKGNQRGKENELIIRNYK